MFSLFELIMLGVLIAILIASVGTLIFVISFSHNFKDTNDILCEILINQDSIADSSLKAYLASRVLLKKKYNIDINSLTAKYLKEKIDRNIEEENYDE